MCLAIPSRIIARDGEAARVVCFGVERDVNLMLLAEPVTVGDYVLLLKGAFAVEKVESVVALETLRLMDSMLAGSSDPPP